MQKNSRIRLGLRNGRPFWTFTVRVTMNDIGRSLGMQYIRHCFRKEIDPRSLLMLVVNRIEQKIHVWLFPDSMSFEGLTIYSICYNCK